MIARYARYTIVVGLVLVWVGCASSKDTEEESTQQFSQNKETVLDEEEREAQEERERRQKMREQQDMGGMEAPAPEPEPTRPRQTIPAAELPTIGACDEPGNVTACGTLDGPSGEVRVTASMAPAVMSKGPGQMQIGAVLNETRKQLDTLLPCYGWAHLNEDAETTEYDVEIDVKIDGEVSAARVRPTSSPVGAAGCMEERMESWAMPLPSGGGATVIATVTFAAK